MATENKYGLYKLGLVLDKTKSWIDSLKEVVQDPTVVTVNIVNDYIESEIFCIEYIDLNDNLCSEECAEGFRFKTPFKNKSDEVIYGFFQRNNKGSGYVGVRWFSLKYRRMKKMQELGLILSDSWDKLRSICGKEDLEDYGDYLQFPEIYYNKKGYEHTYVDETKTTKTPVTRETAKYIVIRTTLQDKNGSPLIGWFISKKNTTNREKQWNGIFWGSEDDFLRAVKAANKIRIGRFIFKSEADRDDFLIKLGKMILDESWELKNKQANNFDDDQESFDYIENHQMPNIILASYIQYELDRLFYESNELHRDNKIIYNEDKTRIYFNTNLMTYLGEDALIVGQLTQDGDITKCEFNPSMERLRKLGFDDTKTPEAPEFFTGLKEIYFETDKSIELNCQHIIDDRRSRFPKKYQKEAPAVLRAKINHAIDFAKEIAKRNYKFIIPTYYPESKRIQFLMPIYLNREDFPHKRPDLALVLNPSTNAAGEAYYEAKTALNLVHAYVDARLIAKPYEPWLTKDVIK